MGCIVITSAITRVLKEEASVIPVGEESFKLQKPMFSLNVLWGALALTCLTIGGNIAFGGISAAISGTAENFDHVSIYSGLADVASALFGGAPIEVVITPTAAAPNPKISAVILMAIMAGVLFTKSLSKIAKFIPFEAIAGTLFVLGAIVTIPENVVAAFSNATPSGALAASIAMVVTAFSDPFLGLVAGVAVNLIAVPLGL